MESKCKHKWVKDPLAPRQATKPKNGTSTTKYFGRPAENMFQRGKKKIVQERRPLLGLQTVSFSANSVATLQLGDIV